jgi:hypothetical protein
MAIRVSINDQKRETIRTVNVGANRQSISQLTDVDDSNKKDGDTIVYVASTGKYTVKELPILDGGTF